MQRAQKRLVQQIYDSKRAWLWFFITLAVVALLTVFGPAEHSLGTHIRIVYLHGAWAWSALAAISMAGVLGGLGLVLRQRTFQLWSSALGRTGLVFWVTYLPLSLIAMQSNWNGLFLAEPRWRVALVFSIAGILLQSGLALAGSSNLISGLNLTYWIVLMIALRQTPNVMHPASPILNSNSWHIQLYFLALLLLTLLAAWQMAKWWYHREPARL